MSGSSERPERRSTALPALPATARWGPWIGAVGLSVGSLLAASRGGIAAASANIATVALLAFLLLRGERRRDALRRTRLLLLAALGTAFATGLLQFGYQLVTGHPTPTPWFTDAVSLSYVPLTVAGLLSIPSGSRRVGYRSRAVADGALAASSLWYLLLGLGLHTAHLRAHQAWLGHLVTLAYPVGDVFVVATALTVLARCLAPARRMVGWMVTGLTVAAANDTWTAMFGQPGVTARPALLYQSALLLLLGAAVAPAVRSVPDHVEAGAPSAIGAVPFLPLFACMAWTLWRIVHGQGMPKPQLLPALVVAAALTARQLADSRDKHRLVLRLRERELGLQSALRRDDLTGLVNRLGFNERLELALEGLRAGSVTLALLDLNDFKLINDNHGHGVGDVVLRAVAGRLSAAVRDGDVVARLGGDEFAILAHGVDGPEHDAFATRLLGAFDEPVAVGPRRFTVSTSIGVVSAQPADRSADLLAHADAAMYQAKESKQRGSALARLSEDARVVTSRQLRLREEIAAPDRTQFSVEYQPVVDLATGRIRGLEALIRWHHPDLGEVPPDLFIPLAEQAGTIGLLGEQVLATAVADLARITRLNPGHRLAVGVNVSPRQLVDDGFVDHVLETIDRHGLATDQLVLEITEQAFEADLDALSAATEQLMARGVSVAVDDFGTGYSSLQYLHRLPLDVLKIDRAFVAETTARAASHQLVTALTTMASTLGLQVVAEGIETIDQLRLLQQINCELGQGYLFSAPAPIEVIETMLGNDHRFPVGSGDGAPLGELGPATLPAPRAPQQPALKDRPR